MNVRALVLVCLYAATTATNYTNHGPVIDVIAAEFGLDAASAGAIATAFFAGSAAMMLIGGWLADRVGTRRMITLGFGIVVISNLACGLASPAYPILLGWRFVGGMGTGLAFAAGAAYINAIFGPRGAHLAQGLYGASFLAGSASSLLFMPALAGPADDWRLAYTLSGLGVGAAWLAWTIGAPAEPRAGAGAAGRTSAGLGAALATRNSWLFGLCHMCGFGLAMILGTWVTSYLGRAFGLPLAAAGLLGSLVLVMGIVGRSLGGLVVERGLRPVSLIRGALLLTAIGLVVMALPSGQLGVALAGVAAAGLGIGLPYSALFNGAAASVPNGPALAQAMVGTAGTSVAVVGPPIVGGLLDLTGSFGADFLVLAAFTVTVLLTTRLIQPFGAAAGRQEGRLGSPASFG